MAVEWVQPHARQPMAADEGNQVPSVATADVEHVVARLEIAARDLEEQVWPARLEAAVEELDETVPAGVDRPQQIQPFGHSRPPSRAVAR